MEAECTMVKGLIQSCAAIVFNSSTPSWFFPSRLVHIPHVFTNVTVVFLVINQNSQFVSDRDTYVIKILLSLERLSKQSPFSFNCVIRSQSQSHVLTSSGPQWAVAPWIILQFTISKFSQVKCAYFGGFSLFVLSVHLKVILITNGKVEILKYN